MARLIRHTATAPYRIEQQDLPKDKPLFICACGFSQKMPICNGTHKGQCREEKPGTLYVYDPQRRHVIETRPDQG